MTNRSTKIILFSVILSSIFITSGCKKQPIVTTLEIEEINCKLTQAEKDEIIKIADFEFDFYHSIFKEKYPTLKVKLFGDSIEYKQYQVENSKTRARNGFYSSLKNCAIVNKNDRFMKTIFHELNHFIIHSYMTEIPKWINEGLSEYFEYAFMDNGFIKINPQLKKVERLKKWTGEKDKIDLEDFFTWSNTKWKEEDFKPEHFSYTLSWGVVYYFMEDKMRKDIFRQIISAVKKGKKSTEAINKFYPGGVEQLHYDFVIHVDLRL